MTNSLALAKSAKDDLSCLPIQLNKLVYRVYLLSCMSSKLKSLIPEGVRDGLSFNGKRGGFVEVFSVSSFDSIGDKLPTMCSFEISSSRPGNLLSFSLISS